MRKREREKRRGDNALKEERHISEQCRNSGGKAILGDH